VAVSKERKNEIITEYTAWLNKSRAMVLVEYKGLTMGQLDELRGKMREVGGEFHVVKNTLGKRAFREYGLPIPEGYFEDSTAIGFAFEDVAAVAKTITGFARTAEFFKIKGGYLGNQPVDSAGIRDLAELPPLPVMRARLLGTLMAPASQLARLLAEPARQLAAVVKAHADQGAVPNTA